MRMDSEMIGILLSDSMHYTIVVSLEMSDEPNLSHSIKDSHYVGCLFLCATKKELTRHEQTPQSMRKKSLSAITSK